MEQKRVKRSLKGFASVRLHLFGTSEFPTVVPPLQETSGFNSRLEKSSHSLMMTRWQFQGGCDDSFTDSCMRGWLALEAVFRLSILTPCLMRKWDAVET